MITPAAPVVESQSLYKFSVVRVDAQFDPSTEAPVALTVTYQPLDATAKPLGMTRTAQIPLTAGVITALGNARTNISNLLANYLALTGATVT